MPDGLFDDTRTRSLRAALAAYTVDGVSDAIGPVGRAALQRGDLAGVARQLRGRDDPLSTLIRLFVVGDAASPAAAARALDPLPLSDALAAGLIETTGTSLRAALDLRPYGEAGGPVGGAEWWVVSDLGSDVRPGALRPDHVLGVGPASLTLAQAVPRDPVGRALDVGTGSGVQALHLAGHAAEVVATDTSARALRLAATTAALSGQCWELRRGSLYEPVAGERFDLIVANPPFVVSAGRSDWTYRDSGLAGDAITEQLVRSTPDRLSDGGSAHVLGNWIIPAEGDWRERVGDWFAGSGCDAWVWQRDVADPGEYVTLWLRDAGLVPRTPEWRRRYDAWLDWFAGHDVVAIGMGLVSLWRTGRADPTVVLEDVPQAVSQPVGVELPAWVRRQRWLAATDDEGLLNARLRAAPDLVRDRADVLGPDGWVDGTQHLRQSHGLRWTVDTDDAVAALVAACDGTTALGTAAAVLAAGVGHPEHDVRAAALPVVRDLVARGFLLPPAADAAATSRVYGTTAARAGAS